MNYEELFSNLFYIFGSWTLVQGAYFLAVTSTENHNFESKKERRNFAIRQFFVCYGVIGFFVGAGLGFVQEDKWFTATGFIQAVIAVGIPIAGGVHKGLKTSTLHEPLSLQSSVSELPKDLQP